MSLRTVPRPSHSAESQCAILRIAATSELHIRGCEALDAVPGLGNLREMADLLVVAGDITEGGRLAEAAAAAELLSTVGVPVVAVLGNHDRRTLRRTAFRRTLQ